MRTLPAHVDADTPASRLATARLQDPTPMPQAVTRCVAQLCGALQLAGRLDLDAGLECDLADHPNAEVRRHALARARMRTGDPGIWVDRTLSQQDFRLLWWLRTTPVGAHLLPDRQRRRLGIAYRRPALLNPATDLSRWTTDDAWDCLNAGGADSRDIAARVIIARHLRARAPLTASVMPSMTYDLEHELPVGVSPAGGAALATPCVAMPAVATILADPGHAGPSFAAAVPWQVLTVRPSLRPGAAPSSVHDQSAVGVAVRRVVDAMAGLPDGPQMIDAFAPGFTGTVGQMLALLARMAHSSTTHPLQVLTA